MVDYDFSPPSQEEKKQFESSYDFSPPTEEERAKFQTAASEVEPSTLSDVGLGAAQGLTLGFSDEAIAAAKALAETAASKEKSVKDLPALYRQFQQLEQQKVKEARERSPWAFGAGELAGAVPLSILTGGLGAVAEGATAARELSTAARIGQAALSGAKIGAVSGAGTMEAPLLSKEGLEETAKGAAVGGILGGATSGLVEGAKGMYRALAPESRPLKLAGVAAKEAFEGRPSPTTTAGEALGIQEEKAARAGFAEKFFGKETGLQPVLGEKISDVTKKAAEQGVRIGQNPETTKQIETIRNLLQNFPGKIRGKELNSVENLIQEYLENNQGLVNPNTANEARRALRDTYSKLYRTESPEILEPIKELSFALESELNKIPGFAEANKAYSAAMKVPEALLGPGKKVSRISSEVLPEKVEQKVGKLISGAEVLGETGVKARERLGDLEKLTRKAFELDPESFKKVGINAPEELFTEIKRQAELSSIRQGIGGVDRAPPDLKGIITKALGFTHPYKLGMRAGAAAKTIKDVSSAVYKLPDAGLIKLADKLSGSAGLQGLADSLRKSVQQGNIRMKNATMFALLQRPEARAIMGEETPSEEESK